MVDLLVWWAAWMGFSVLIAALPAWFESAVPSLAPGFRRGAWFVLALRAAVPVGLVPLVLPSPASTPVPFAPSAGVGVPPGVEPFGGIAAGGGGGLEVTSILVVVYLVGLVVVWARQFPGRRAWARALRAGRMPSSRVHALVDAEAARLSLARPPRVTVVPEVPSPCLVGLVSPRLVLPDEGRFTDAELVWMVRHELEHRRAGDLWFTAVVQALVGLFWFLPGLWWIAHRFRMATEEACDRRVLAGCDADLRQSYALTLLKLVEPSPSLRRLTAMASPVGWLKRRLGLICRPRRSSVPALVVLAATVLVSGAWGAGSLPTTVATLEPGWPFAPGTPCWVTSGYGEMENPITKKPYFHQGIDLAARTNTPVLALWPGIVTETGFDADQGFYLKVDLGEGWALVASHLAASPTVQKGQRVKPDQVVGHVGSTGLSTGPHLHLEVWKNGAPVDPAPFLNSAKGAPSER